jgi:apolipoprotein N-acyltransferase
MPRDLVLFALSLGALGLAFPPFRLGFFACWAIIPLFLLLENKSAGAAFRWGYGAGLLANVITLQAAFLIPSLDRMLAVLASPVAYGVLAMVLAQLHRQWPQGYLLAAPLLWAIMEYMQTHVSQGMAGLPLGYTQDYYASLMRNVFSESIFLVSAWVVAINVLLLLLWRHRGSLLWLSGLGVLLIMFLLLPYAFSKLAWRDLRIFDETIIEVHHTPALKQFMPLPGGREEVPELFAMSGF